MIQFALQVDLADGGTLHMFGKGEQAHTEFLRIRDGWRDQPPEAYYTFVEHGARPRRVFVSDIREVRFVMGGERP